MSDTPTLEMVQELVDERIEAMLGNNPEQTIDDLRKSLEESRAQLAERATVDNHEADPSAQRRRDLAFDLMMEDEPVPESLLALATPAMTEGEAPNAYYLQYGVAAGTSQPASAFWGAIAGASVDDAPVLFQVIAARYVDTSGVLIAVDATPASSDTLVPVWDWPRFHE